MDTEHNSTIFQINHVSKRPPSQTDQAFILSDLTFEIADGETFSILGPSGAGKSTLLRLLNALDEPDTGEIFFRGKSLREYNVFQLRQSVGMVFQRPALLPGTVRDNLDYP
ncbi:MAG TPA: ATP-binding cassette domain-containing protein, partial [bacterium]|nr:ATP-binding cassette domain-containing protein [bacterium]